MDNNCVRLNIITAKLGAIMMASLEIEQLEIIDFLRQCPPLRRLAPAQLEGLVAAIKISYARRGSTILSPNNPNSYFYLIRSGAIEVKTPENNLHGHFGEGEWFGYRSAMNQGKVSMPVIALEDALFYQMPYIALQLLFEQDTSIKHFFVDKKAMRVRSAISEMRQPQLPSQPQIQPQASSITNTKSITNTNTSAKTSLQSHNDAFHILPVTDLMRKAIHVAPDVSIQSAAQTMSQLNTSLLLIMENNALIGVVTDQDLRQRVVASGIDIQRPIREIMTEQPITISSKAQVIKALLTMAKHNIDELPIIDQQKQVLGVVTTRDMVKAQGQNAVYLVSEINRCRKLSRLQDLSAQLPDLLVTMVKQHLSAYDIGQTISTVGQAINVRLLQLAEQKFGAPPIPYAWAIAGSMGRYEQTVHSDQDNALILSDEYSPEVHDAYFQPFCQYVSDGLNACGYVYCPGNVMATNPQWRQPLAIWLDYFRNWVETPKPQALMYTSIFFDMRVIYGDERLIKPIKHYIQEKAPQNSIFLSYMAANALHSRPPLGFFRNFVLDKHGEKDEALDMKKRGVMPIIDLARIYALASGVNYLNTHVRLQESAAAGGLSQQGMADLQDAYELINSLRLQHQALNIEAGHSPDNFVPPEQMSALERRHLKDAFSVVSTMQEAMAQAYQTGRF